MTGLLMTARELTDPARRASQMGMILALAWLGHGLGGYQRGLARPVRQGRVPTPPGSVVAPVRAARNCAGVTRAS